MAFSPDGQFLAFGRSDNTVQLWNIQEGQESGRLSGHGTNVYALAFSPDGNLLASISTNGVIILWQLDSGAAIRHLKGLYSQSVSGIWFLDNQTFATATNSGQEEHYVLWKADTLQELIAWVCTNRYYQPLTDQDYAFYKVPEDVMVCEKDSITQSIRETDR